MQCPGDGGLSERGQCRTERICLSLVCQLLEIQAQYHRQSLGSLDSALAELKESHSKTGTHLLSTQPRESYNQAREMRVWLVRLGKMGFSLPATASHIRLLGQSLRQTGNAACPAFAQ